LYLLIYLLTFKIVILYEYHPLVQSGPYFDNWKVYKKNAVDQSFIIRIVYHS